MPIRSAWDRLDDEEPFGTDAPTAPVVQKPLHRARDLTTVESRLEAQRTVPQNYYFTTYQSGTDGVVWISFVFIPYWDEHQSMEDVHLGEFLDDVLPDNYDEETESMFSAPNNMSINQIIDQLRNIGFRQSTRFSVFVANAGRPRAG